MTPSGPPTTFGTPDGPDNKTEVGNKVSTPCDQVPSRHQVLTDVAEETLTVSAPANATWTLVVASPRTISTG